MSQQSHPYRTNRDLFSNHYLNEHLRQTEPYKQVGEDEVREAYDEIREIWNAQQDNVEGYKESHLERHFIKPIFEILDIPFEIQGTVQRSARVPDYGFFPSTEAAQAAFDRDDFYEEAIAVADAKRWGRKLDTRGEEKRDFENPSYQIHAYLQETPPQWAVLTNGKQWRIYYGPTSHRLDSYYEIDLPELFEFVEEDGGIEDFKDFYLFFRQQAFLPDQSGDCFLDDVYDDSSVFAEAIGEDLQNNIYEAIRVLAEGFLDTNDDLEEDDLPLIHDSSLIYLYRLIFVLYAESEGRDLLPTDNDIYSESYSLNELKQTVADRRDETQQHYQTWQTNLWDRLEELFVLIDRGSQGKDIPKDQLYIPAYNGGLFRTSPDPDDSAEAQFLATHEADDVHLAEVIDLLTRRKADEGDGQVFVDYSSLDERHLGSIYEGLLEYKLDVADEPLTVDDGEYSPAGDGDKIEVQEGDVYLRTDAGERKATGSYYTPEYIVEYIVDDTVGPLVDDIREDLVGTESYSEGGFAAEFTERVLGLKILDPAMGSGHFLVNVVDYLAREIIDAQERQDQQAVKRGDVEAISDPRTEEGELRDINWARRKVAQRCIYGVDLNPLATELAKVSLWLRTLAAEQPLAFLDHHLKTGNSLVGSDIDNVLSNGDDSTRSGQTQLSDWMDQARQRALEHVMERFVDLFSIENETLEDIKEMEEVYEEIREDSLYQRLLAMVNVHTASQFGLEVPEDAEKQMAEALRDDNWERIESENWFIGAQEMAGKKSFFHWELEFPVAFYGEDGKRLTSSGFDAVIGNPPWAITRDESLKQYLSGAYRHQSGKPDLYRFFLEKCLSLSTHKYGMITPNTWLSIPAAKQIRGEIIGGTRLRSATLIPNDAFSGVDANMISFIIDGTANAEAVDVYDLTETSVDYMYSIDYDDIGDEYQLELRMDTASLKLARKLEENSRELGEISESTTGYQLYHNTIHDPDEIDGEVYHSERQENENYIPEIRGSSIHRYFVDPEPDGYVDETAEFYRLPPEQFLGGPRILIREITSKEGIVSSYIEQELFYPKSVFGMRSDTLPETVLTALLNSNVLYFYFLVDGQKSTQDLFPRISKSDLTSLPISKEVDGPIFSDEKSGSVSYLDKLNSLAATEQDARRSRFKLNLSLMDYLGNYSEGPKLTDVGFYQPTDGSILNATADEYNNHQIQNVRTVRDDYSITIEVTARYKPEDQDKFETDGYGYTETDYFEAFTLTDLTDKEAALIEAFVPVAVEDEIGGFSDNATKTISLIDRLKDITLPDIDDVQDDLQRYIKTKQRAEELDEKIEKTDQLIDEMVYDLYDLTEEEIEIVEEAVNDD